MKTLKSEMSDRGLLAAVGLSVGLVLILAWSFGPSQISSKVSASDRDTEGGATAEMLNYALNFRSAQSLGVFGGNSVSDQGSEIRGIVGSTGDVHGVQSNALSTGDATGAQRDLLDAFSAVDQLPCININDANLGGHSFGPGVYCVGSATIAGRMTVDAGGDANARFVFRVNGTFTADDASSIVREGGAQATNVYIFSRDAATIGTDAMIGANVISRDEVTVGHGSTVSGKVIAVNGDVNTNSDVVASGTGFIKICKQLAPNDSIPEGTIFDFTVSGIAGTIQVPAGLNGAPNCASPVLVATGNVAVIESVRANTAVVGITSSPTNRLASSSLSLRLALISVPDGDLTDQTTVLFTSQTTRTGTVMICKFGLDADVTGFFSYTIQGVPAQTFSIPVGFCDGPITVTIPQTNAGPSPSPTQAFTANVTELAQATFRCEDIKTFPDTALNGSFPDLGFNSSGASITNTNGCYANISLNEGTGGQNLTTVRFFSRSLPGRIKVCTITADPVNIPVGTVFSFTISGVGWVSPTNPDAPNFLPQTATFDVLAGPAIIGGFCGFAPLTWVVGQPVFIGENGINLATNTAVLPLGAAATQAALRVSRIQATTAFMTAPVAVSGSAAPFPAVASAPNPNVFGSTTATLAGPNAQIGGVNYIGYGVINARNTSAEIEFANFVYRPAILKLCNVPTGGLEAGRPFSFTIAPVDPLTTWRYPTGTFTVAAGSCTFVNGPLPADVNFPGVGLFNFGTSIVVTELPVAGTFIPAITSPTLTPVPNPNPPNFVGTLTTDRPNRRGTLTFNNILKIANNFYFNELRFVNDGGADPPPPRAARFDFDGDRLSDVAVFRPSDGTWYYSPSSVGQGFRSIRFGQAGDIPVAADYDGDGKTDPAVYRDGQWFVLGSYAGGFSSASFGLPTDIPQVGDYDGDSKADFAVYRPSNGTWYIMASAAGFNAVQFGISTDIPVAADFDGDGKTDQAVYRNGMWYLNRSTAGFYAVQFGIAGDIPVKADYDGDGRADVAVYRGGTWYISSSTTGFSATRFGTATDTPVPADYNGDGKTDLGVYRSSTTIWYFLNSSQGDNVWEGLTSVQFGSAGDVLMHY